MDTSVNLSNVSHSQPAGGFDKLHEDGMDVLRDAKAAPGYRDAEQEARDRRVAELVCLCALCFATTLLM